MDHIQEKINNLKNTITERDKYTLIELYDDPLVKSIRLNYIFYITTLFCLYIISKYSKINFFFTIITFIAASFNGYFVHFIAHYIDFEAFMSKQNNYITNNKYLNNITLWFCRILDFHEKTHHDSTINKTTKNLIVEFLLNFFTQGGFALCFYYIMKKLNGYIFLLWGLLYCTIHIINYNIVPSKVHINHHMEKTTNYGIDFWDIMLGTKYDNNSNDVEIINHYAINIAILTGIIILLIKYDVFYFL
jgi:hypothetical protein